MNSITKELRRPVIFYLSYEMIKNKRFIAIHSREQTTSAGGSLLRSISTRRPLKEHRPDPVVVLSNQLLHASINNLMLFSIWTDKIKYYKIMDNSTESFVWIVSLVRTLQNLIELFVRIVPWIYTSAGELLHNPQTLLGLSVPIFMTSVRLSSSHSNYYLVRQIISNSLDWYRGNNRIIVVIFNVYKFNENKKTWGIRSL